uniref:ABC transporter family protein n=1 Tax=Rhizophora mucronata TaxID=61149 RepID=A0A2P2MFL1_RHIMU
MADTSSHRPSSFGTQANALFRKNLTYQKRNGKTNCRLIFFPVVLCVLLKVLQIVVDGQLSKSVGKCGCDCVKTNDNGSCTEVCGLQFSNSDQASNCPIPSPPEWPPLLQVPSPEYRAVKTSVFADLPNESCRRTGSCPVTILVTGSNQSLGEILAGNMVPTSIPLNSSNVLGTETQPAQDNFIEPGFSGTDPLYNVQRKCASNSTVSKPFQFSSIEFTKEIKCVEGIHVWRNSPSDVNKELYEGYHRGNSDRKINEILAAYDFLNSTGRNLNVNIWYNSTYKDKRASPPRLLRIPLSVNLVSNAYLEFLRGPGTQMVFEFVKEMPKPASETKLDIASLLGTLFFTWVVLQLFPVALTSLVYEKQQKLRIMMKMHGLGDGPYWMISYAYFLAISLMYMLVFVIFGSVMGLKFFKLNDYSIQFVFYFIYVNLQISGAFMAAAFFSNVKTATVVGYICVFGTGLLGGFLFQNFLEDPSFPRSWVIVLELYPGFSLYRGLYEFGQYSFMGNLMGTHGMQWIHLNDPENGMKDVLIIMFVEWLVVLFGAYYMDLVLSSAKSPLFFLTNFRKESPSSIQKLSLARTGSKVVVDMNKPDVTQEREKVEQLLLEPKTGHAIICDNLKKVYPGRDGNPEKFAVKGLSLALPRAECFGMLGPNGAGKTSFISMMIGLTKPTSGTAFVQDLDLRTQMDWIYTSMGVCPQHNLLWETLTGREHLLFYGRLKNLKGSALTAAVEESLKSVNLFNGGVADKQVGKYSGGMKRRLSVAISLIGDPKVVYMDEPSTGLDPASRSNLWTVVKRAKRDRAIVLTSMLSPSSPQPTHQNLGMYTQPNL